MAHRPAGPVVVGRFHPGERRLMSLVIDQYQGEPLVERLLEPGDARRRRQDGDDSSHQPRLEQPDPLGLVSFLVHSGGQEQRALVRRGGLSHADDHFRRPAKLKPRHEEADRARAPPGQGGGHRISHELPPFQDLQDPGAGLGAHVGLLIENPRDGGPGDARFACDIVNGESDFARHSSSIPRLQYLTNALALVYGVYNATIPITATSKEYLVSW